MAFLRNDAVNRVNLHYGVQALAQSSGGVFFLTWMLKAGVPVWGALLAQAGVLAGRFLLRPLVLPLAKRWGLRAMVVVGCLLLALQYPLLGQVRGIGLELLVLVIVAAIGDAVYWLSYNAYFAAIGDAEHRGHQISAREAIVALVGVVAPLLGAWALVTVGPGAMFAGVGLVQALAALPLIGAPDVTVARAAPGAFRAARIGVILSACDGWFDAWFIMAWQLALFVALGSSVTAYGGAMALAALAGAAAGLVLGRHIDLGHGRRAVTLVCAVLTLVLLLRAASLGSPWLAALAHALGAPAMTLLSPTLGAAVYNLGQASPCPFRFYMATEAGWDLGCFFACLLGAGLAASSAPLALGLLLALPALAAMGLTLRRYYGDQDLSL